MTLRSASLTLACSATLLKYSLTDLLAWLQTFSLVVSINTTVAVGLLELNNTVSSMLGNFFLFKLVVKRIRTQGH